jgi:hypothetical protein
MARLGIDQVIGTQRLRCYGALAQANARAPMMVVMRHGQNCWAGSRVPVSSFSRIPELLTWGCLKMSGFSQEVSRIA